MKSFFVNESGTVDPLFFCLEHILSALYVEYCYVWSVVAGLLFFENNTTFKRVTYL